MSISKDKFFAKHLVVEGKDAAIFVRPGERISDKTLSKLRRRFNTLSWRELMKIIKEHAPEKLI